MLNPIKTSSAILLCTLAFSSVCVTARVSSPQAIAPFTVGTDVAAAQPRKILWSPEKGRGSVGGTLSGGRRGTQSQCTNHTGAAHINLLVPDDASGLLTTVANPSFYWHVTTPHPVEMTFVLQDPTAATPVYTQVVKAEKTGITGLQLPASQSLRVGTRYRWTVFIACAENQANEVYARSFIERVDRSNLSQQIHGQSPLNQASTYAQAGIWYDAVAPLVQAVQTDPTNTQATSELQSLLSQAKKTLPF